MDEKLIKLMSQLGLIAVIIWAVAGAFGQREKAAVKPCRKRPKAQGGVWNHTPVSAPNAAPGLAFTYAPISGS